MIRVKENIESLNAIREKCKARETDFNDVELTHLNLVFIELQKSYGKKHVRPLDRSCSSCVLRFMSSVHNYIVNEELEEAVAKTSKSFVEATKSFKNLNASLSELQESEVSNAVIDASNEYVWISSGEVEVEQDENEKLTLPELREKYPDIKARSKEKFLRLLNESK